MSTRSILLFVLAAVIVIGSPLTAFCQGTAQAQLNGSVHDPRGAAVVQASITLRDVDTNLTHAAPSNAQGYYNLTNLPPGNYELTAVYSGFGKYVQTGIVLYVGQVATIDITLKVAGAAEKVEVTAEAPVIEPTRTEVSQVIETQQIQSLPINGRLFTDFALLTPGVATGRTGLQSTFTDPTTTRISFGGQRDLNNSVTVDGADNISTVTGSQRATPSQEAVSEFRVVNNSYGAEYGRALGGIVNIVTKSGTNQLHGSLYEYLENNKLDARTILTLPQFNTFRQNQFGATLGGPVRKDQTFFFANYEGQRRAQSPTYPTVFVDNLTAINALKSSLGLPIENPNLLKTVNYDEGLVKIDHQLNTNNRLSVRYSAEDSTALNLLVGETLDGGGIGAPSEGRNGLLRDQALVGTWTSTINTNTVNSALVQWARRNYGFPSVTAQPDLDIPNFLSFGRNFGTFDRYNESRFQFSDTISWVKGKHLAKFGFDANYIRNFVISPQFTPARVIFASLGDMLVSGPADWGVTPCAPPLPAYFTSPCPAAFFWNAAVPPGPIDPTTSQPTLGTSWTTPYANSVAQNYLINLNHSYWGFFAQDQWRVTPKFTLNYGMRYDFEKGLPAGIGSDYHEFQPRIGISYSPDTKTVVRAGFGMFYDKIALTFPFLGIVQRPPTGIPGLPGAPNQVTGTFSLSEMNLPSPCVLNGCPPPGPLLPPGTVPPFIINQAFQNLFASGSFPLNAPWVQGGQDDTKLRAPYTEQASLEINRDIGKGITVGASYMFVAGHRQERVYDANVGPPVGVEPGTGKDIYNFSILAPNIAAPCAFCSPGTNGLVGITDSTGNSSYNGLTLQFMEKAGQYFHLNANYTFSKAMDNGSFVTFVNFAQSVYQRNLERAISNQDVRHRFVANFVASAPQHTFLRNFELSSIVTLESGRPFTLFVGFDANDDGNPVTDRVGASRRNTYYGDPLRTVDLRLSRAIHFTERYKVDLAIDGFNLFNRANVNEVFTVYGAPDFLGPVPQHYKDGITSPANPTFGVPRTMFSARVLQLSAKFRF